MPDIYRMTIKNTDARITEPKPKYVLIQLDDYWFERWDSWWIPFSYNNNWIGTGMGKYKYSDSTLRFMDENGKVRIVFYNINYPDDCTPKEEDEDYKYGEGQYFSPYVKEWLTCEWSNRTTVPVEKK